MCDDMCDVLYDVMLYCNVVQSFVVERHNGQEGGGRQVIKTMTEGPRKLNIENIMENDGLQIVHSLISNKWDYCFAMRLFA